MNHEILVSLELGSIMPYNRANNQGFGHYWIISSDQLTLFFLQENRVMNIFHAVIFQEWFNEVRIPFWHPTFVEKIDPKNNVQVVVQVIGTTQLKNLLFKLAHLPRHYKNCWTSQTTVPICSSLPPKKQTRVENKPNHRFVFFPHLI